MNQDDSFRKECSKVGRGISDKISRISEKYVGRDALFLKGKYVGRSGMIVSIAYEDIGPSPGFTFRVRPYSKANPAEFLDSHVDSRRFWRLGDIMLY